MGNINNIRNTSRPKDSKNTLAPMISLKLSVREPLDYQVLLRNILSTSHQTLVVHKNLIILSMRKRCQMVDQLILFVVVGICLGSYQVSSVEENFKEGTLRYVNIIDDKITLDTNKKTPQKKKKDICFKIQQQTRKFSSRHFK